MDKRPIAQRLSQARQALLSSYPFFGRLLLKLRFGTADCGTAFTDMTHIVFDPIFAGRLSDEELGYVLVHELLHCVLKHCTRGVGKDRYRYNIACDIVVNSTMMEMFGKEELTIDKSPVMHIAPDGTEGRDLSAEEIYAMLMDMDQDTLERAYPGITDDHSEWRNIKSDLLEEKWDRYVLEASRNCGKGSGIPSYIARYLKDIDRNPRTNWRQVLHDFIQFDRGDFDFKRPDKRYMSNVFLPSFRDNVYGSKVEKLWFLIDTSGSVNDEAVSVSYNEICCAIEQIGSINGYISYFDHMVSEPVPFESVEDILATKPIGGGGTSFSAIFAKLQELEDEDLPSVMVIITDGYSNFPEEDAALGVPVIWLIVDSSVEPPWGECTYITTEDGI